MHPALMTGKSGLDCQQSNINIISNNLANVNTHGFKKTRGVFKELEYQNIKQAGTSSSAGTEVPSGIMLGTGAKLAGTVKDFRVGEPIRTDNPMHLYIGGRGFFQITQADGTTAYSRDGSFQVDSGGAIVDHDGRQLNPNITIPNNVLNVMVGKDGTVTATIPGTTTPVNLGSIQLADFVNPAGLQPKGEGLYIETAASGAPIVGNPDANGLGALEQGSLENSNVNSVEELVNLIQTQRAYEMNAKSLETVNDMLRFVAQVL